MVRIVVSGDDQWQFIVVKMVIIVVVNIDV